MKTMEQVTSFCNRFKTIARQELSPKDIISVSFPITEYVGFYTYIRTKFSSMKNRKVSLENKGEQIFLRIEKC